MRRRIALALAVIALGFAACDPPEEDATPRDDADEVDLGALALVSLTTEDTCAALLDWYKREATANVDKLGGGVDYYFGAPPQVTGRATAGSAAGAAEQSADGAAPVSSVPPVAGEDYSATNVQEEGVDEPDVVKTDGEVLVTLAGGHLRVVDVAADTPRLLASLPLPEAHTLFLAGDRVLAIGGVGSGVIQPMRGGAAVDMIAPGWGGAAKTNVTIVDIADPRAPKTVDAVELDGSYVAARMTDGVARLVLRWAPNDLIAKMYQPTDQQQLPDPKPIIEASTIDDWKPEHVPCDAVHHPKGFTGTSTVSVVTIDPEDPAPGNGAAVAGAGETVYASAERLYVTSNQWFAADSPRVAGPTTEIHAFDISDDITTTYVASGSVDGMLLNQFSLSEHEGVLRVATTKADATTGQTESQVVTLRPNGPALDQIGVLGGLGKTEQIYSVRFLGTTGYVVTFRQTDPLYVVDLSDPAEPVLKGELKIPGYSAYLHPIGDGRLLGVGQNATDEGRRLGAQLSLFDVSDPADPKQLATHDLRAFGSGAEYDHHAFLWWARTNLVVVPVETLSACSPQGFCAEAYRPGAVGVEVEGDGFVERARIEHPTRMPISRSLVVDGRLLTISDSGLLAAPLDALADGDWMAF